MIFPFDFRKPLLGALMAFLPVAAAAQPLTPAPEASTGRTAKHGEAAKYMVAAANPLAAEAGREILRRAAAPSMRRSRSSSSSTWSSRRAPASAAAPSWSTGTPAPA